MTKQVNKVTITQDDEVITLLDVSQTTATDETVLAGYTYKRADGTDGTGTLEQSVAELQENKTVTIKKNGNTIIDPDDGYEGIKTVNVNVEVETVDKPDQTKTVIPTKEQQIITPDSDYELSSVTVEPIPEVYIVPAGTYTIKENVEAFDISQYATVTVDVDNVTTLGYIEEVEVSDDAYAVHYKYMTGDIDAYDGDYNITQNGVIPCAGKNMASDIIVKVPLSNMIAFTIDNVIYKGEINMTWKTWIESEYNDSDYYINSDDSISDGSHYIVDVVLNDIIRDRERYNIEEYIITDGTHS